MTSAKLILIMNLILILILELFLIPDRWETLSKLSEKKQAFNAYKIQKQKEEKEEARLLAIKNKEDLEQFLMTTDRMSSSVKYYRWQSCSFLLPRYPIIKVSTSDPCG